MKQVILESDDFGMTTAVSEAILTLLRRGKITTTNCMPTIPEFAESVALCQNKKERTMGIHLIADRHLPAANPAVIPTLLDHRGHLVRFAELKRRIVADELDYDQMRTELIAQIRLAQKYGIIIDHLTTHHGFMNLSPQLYSLVCDIAHEFNLPMRNNTDTGEPAKTLRLRKIAQIKEVKMPDINFMLSGATNPVEALVTAIDQLQDRQTLNVIAHAGRTSALLTERSSFTTIREVDYAALASQELTAAFKTRSATVKTTDYTTL